MIKNTSLRMRKTWLISLLLLFVTFAVFSRVLVADFVQWDDDISVYENPHVQGLNWERLRWMFTDASYALRYKPLTWVSYALIYQFGGLNPFGYHFANLIWHSINAAMVFLVIRRLLTANGLVANVDERLNAINFAAAAGALLWAVNPLRVEPVARVTDLTYSLMLFFLLLSAWFYLRTHQPGAGGHKRRWFYGCSVAAFTLSMLSYPFAVGYGIVLAVLDWYPLRRFESCAHWWWDATARRIWLEKIPFLLVGGIALVTFGARLNPTGVWANQPVKDGLISFATGMQAFYVWTYFVWKPWVPFHLAPVYTTLVQFNPGSWPFWLSAAFVLAITFLVLLKRRQWPWLLALWIIHLVLLLPALGITERPHFASDRYDYLPALVWAVCIAAVLWKISIRLWPRVIGTTVALLLAGWWGSLSYRQTRHWQNSLTLFEHTIRELGNDPYRADIHWRLGRFYAKHGKFDQAVREYQTSLQILPSREAYMDMGELLIGHGQPEAGLTNYVTLLKFGPDTLAHVSAGDTLCALGRDSEAIEHYRAALLLNPKFVPALNNLAWMLATDADENNRNGAEAVQFAEQAAALTRHRQPFIMGTLAAAYAEVGRFEDAIKTAETARTLAESIGDRPLAETNRKLLESYKAGRPYRQPQPSVVPTSQSRP